MNRFARICTFFMKARFLRRDIPLIASFKLTHQCNLACLACPFHLQAGKGNSPMDMKTACSCLDKLADMGCPIVVFEGGEPLLWSDGYSNLNDLVLYARKRFACVAATTNGTFPLHIPTDILWVSVDGTRDIHNHLRSGSYDQVMKNIRSAKHKRLYVHITINRLNWKDLPMMVRTVSAIPTVKGITVQLFYPYNQGEESLALNKEDRREALHQIGGLKVSGYPILNSYWSLNAMIDNSWKCREGLLANVNPDGSISSGCYVKNRGTKDCSQCGFTPVAEASGAYALVPGSIMAGMRIFLSR